MQNGVTRIGYVRNLRRAYRDAAVVINPVRFGTGLKIKTVEALAHGKALVTTSCGVEGLEGAHGRAFLVEDDMPRFGAEVGRLLASPDARRTLAQAAAGFARAEFGRDRVYGALRQLLAGAPPGGELRRAADLEAAEQDA